MILAFGIPSWPLSDTRESVPEIFLRDLSGHLSFIKETKSEKGFGGLKKSTYAKKEGKKKEKKGSF